MEYEKFRTRIVDLQRDWNLFKAEFLDRDGFKMFADNLYNNVKQYNEICITGYFSETIRDELENIIKTPYGGITHNVRLICPEFPSDTRRDRRNIDALKKLVQAGANIKVNNRLHARFLAAYFSGQEQIIGLLVIGSFDFNTECIGRERYDAGIKTTHPDLIRSAKELFEQIWKEPESKPPLEKYPNTKF